MPNKVFKSIWAILPFLLVSASVLSQVDNSTQIQKILELLPKEVRLSSVQPPHVDEVTCGGLWGKNGFVCDKQKLIAYANKDAANIVEAETKFNLTLDSLYETVTGLKDEVSKLTSIQDKELFEEILSNGLIQTIKKEGKACWADMIKARSRSLCSICSANNYRYFDQLKAGLLIDDCRKILNTCEVFFRNTYWLMRLEWTFGSILMNSGENGTRKKENLEQFSNSLKSEGANELAVLLGQGYTLAMKSPTNHLEKKQTQICEKTIRIRGTPILNKLTAFLEDILKKFKEELSGTSTINLRTNVDQGNSPSQQPSSPAPSRPIESPSNRVNSRRLNNAVHRMKSRALGDDSKEKKHDFTFEGDVVVLKPQDNMFTSFVGAFGSDQHIQNTVILPMNLTVCFP